MRLTLLGMPGAGKGTHGGPLAKRLGVPLIAIGDMMRERRELGDELAHEIGLLMDRGQLVSDDIVAQALADKLAAPAAANGFILDGYPRKADQGETLATMLAALPTPMSLDRAIYLDINDDTAIARIARRLICSDCKHPTHRGVTSPGSRCPRSGCSGTVSQRDDDKDETAVRRRLEIFHSETEPLIGYYEREGLLTRIDATSPPDEVLSAIEASIRQKAT